VVAGAEAEDAGVELREAAAEDRGDRGGRRGSCGGGESSGASWHLDLRCLSGVWAGHRELSRPGFRPKCFCLLSVSPSSVH
jgi:hypothetical protein